MSREQHNPKWPSIIETRRQKKKREREEQAAQAENFNAQPIVVEPEVIQAAAPAPEIVSPFGVPAYFPLSGEFQFDSPWGITPETKQEEQEPKTTPISAKKAKARTTTPTTASMVQQQ